MRNATKNIPSLLWEKGIIQEEDIPVCTYGLDIFMSSFFEIATIIVISIFMRNIIEILLFFAGFIPLRLYAGGYHADTKIRCFFVSIAVYGAFSAILFVLPNNKYIVFSLIEILVALIMVIIFSPIIHHNKKVNKSEIYSYRKTSIYICSTQALVILFLTIIFYNNRFIFSLVLGQSAEILSMITAIIKLKFFDNK